MSGKIRGRGDVGKHTVDPLGVLLELEGLARCLSLVHGDPLADATQLERAQRHADELDHLLGECQPRRIVADQGGSAAALRLGELWWDIPLSVAGTLATPEAARELGRKLARQAELLRGLLGTPDSKRTARPSAQRRSFSPGDALEKIISGMTKHHDYATGSCINYEPIKVRAFAEKYGVASGTVSEFLKKHFGGFREYRAMCRRNPAQLVNWLKGQNREFTARHTYGSVPPGEEEPDDD